MTNRSKLKDLGPYRGAKGPRAALEGPKRGPGAAWLHVQLWGLILNSLSELLWISGHMGVSILYPFKEITEGGTLRPPRCQGNNPGFG